MSNLFLVMLASARDIRAYVAEEGYALWPAVMDGYDQPENLGQASYRCKEYIREAKDACHVLRGAAVCSALFPYLCEVKFNRSQEDWDMLMELHKKTILDMLDDYDDAKVKIVEHDDVMAATLVQLAQEFDLELE